MKRPSEIAAEYVRAIEALNIPGFMMSSHDLGKEAMARAILALVKARDSVDAAESIHEELCKL